MSSIILVIAAHPDDEVLGCGATIALHTKEGHEVHVVILAEGLTGRGSVRDVEKYSKEFSKLAQAAHKANQILGVNSLNLLNLPDNRLDSLDRLEITKIIEDYLDRIKPDIIYTHHAGDVNIDHRRVHEAVVTACRPIPHHSVKTLLFFEVASSTEWQIPSSAPFFAPNWFTDITDTLSLKLQALQAYHSEMRPWPHSRSLEALQHLAKWRGATVGVEAAEAFVMGRNLVKEFDKP